MRKIQFVFLILLGAAACEVGRITDDSRQVTSSGPPQAALLGVPASQMVSVFIHFDDEPPFGYREALQGAGGVQVRRATGTRKMIMGQFPAGAIGALRRIAWATAVNAYPNTLRPATETTSWGFGYVDASSAHSVGYTGENGGVRGPVAIIDNGVYDGHYELDANINECRDYVGGNSSSTCYPGSHGTPVAGVLAAEMNSSGTRGIAYSVGFDAIRVCDTTCTWTDLYDGLSRVSTYAAYYHVVNLSLGDCGGEDLPPSEVEELLQDLWENENITIVAAGGNGNESTTGCDANDPVSSLAASPYTIAVSALDSTHTYASGYQYGSEIDLSAPHDVLSTDSAGNVVCCFRGTSFATPHVSAAAALLYELGFTDPDAVRQRLIATATDHGTGGYDIYYGYGVLNIGKAIVLDATIDGPVQIVEDSGECTWEAQPTGGLSPYTYKWYRDYQLVSTSNPYEGMAGEDDFRLEVEVRDASDQVRGTYINVDVSPSSGQQCNWKK